MTRNVAIVHYNTPELTVAAIKSLWKHTPGCKVTIFDNSDKLPFPKMDGVTVIDNTKGQLMDFEMMLKRYPNKLPTLCHWGSEKHIASVELLFSYLPEGFVLLDSDVLVKQDISSFFNPNYAWIGEVDRHPYYWFQAVRLLPMILWINVPMCEEHGIQFWHEGMVYKVSHHGHPYYDTGGSFYFDCQQKNLPGREIKMLDYVEHLGAASSEHKNWQFWLNKHKNLYDTMEEEKKPKTTKKTKKNDDDKILVVIPYCSQGAQGRELEYSVAGWRKHFKEDYLIVLAGEDHPVTKTGDDIICIESPRVPGKNGQYRQHLDYVSCFKKVRAAFPKSKGFVFVADDCYAVNDFDMSDIKVLKKIGDRIPFELSSTNMWQRDAAKTKEKLLSQGYPARNYTTHLPQWYEWDKLEKLWEDYDMENESYVMEDLYYNIYYGNRLAINVHTEYQPFKCGVYRANPRIWYIERSFKDRIWITNSPVGWVSELDKLLADYYGI